MDNANNQAPPMQDPALMQDPLHSQDPDRDLDASNQANRSCDLAELLEIRKKQQVKLSPVLVEEMQRVTDFLVYLEAWEVE